MSSLTSVGHWAKFSTICARWRNAAFDIAVSSHSDHTGLALEHLVDGGEQPFDAGQDECHMAQLAHNPAVLFELDVLLF